MPAESVAGIANPRPVGAKEPAALIRPVLQLISLVVAPTTLLTALLYYFGWLSTNRFSRYFGIDPSTFGFSAQDYLLRAIAPAFGPLIVLAASGLLFVWITGRSPSGFTAGGTPRRSRPSFIPCSSWGSPWPLSAARDSRAIGCSGRTRSWWAP